jgi:hypothetical protein
MPDPADPWVVWSFEHNAWWSPARRGYTPDVDRAGRYTRADAEAIEQQANVVHINEWALPLARARLLATALRRD